MTIYVRALCVLLGALALPAAAQGFYTAPLTDENAIPFATDVVVRPDGGYYVTTKQGRVVGVEPGGSVRDAYVLDLSAEVVASGDRGMLGIALHPDFPARPELYLYYVALDLTSTGIPTPFGYGRLVRYTVTGDGLWRADPASRTVLFGNSYDDGPVACLPFHAGGTARFAPDGSLLVSVGDAAHAGYADVGGNDPECFAPGRAHADDDIGAFRAQRLASANGKILRLDPETGLGLPNNPFYTGDPADTASKVWALGLRNPFRFDIDPTVAVPRLLIGDVGWGTWEELNVSTGGENFGWPCEEGTATVTQYHPLASPDYACDGSRVGVPTPPTAVWNHYYADQSAPSGITGASITGGLIYTGTAYPERYSGQFFFADFAEGWIATGQMLDGRMDGAELIVDDYPGVVDVELDPETGGLVMVNVYTGQLVHLLHAGGDIAPPVARIEAPARSGGAPFEARFDGTASIDPSGQDLAYVWEFGDRAGSDEASPTHVYRTPGLYIATLTVIAQDGRQSQATLPIRVGRAAPELTVIEPSARVVYGNERVALLAEASDPFEDDDAIAVSWEIRLVHNTHEHPGFFQTEGSRATFVALPHGEDGEFAYYEVTSRARDGEGVLTESVVTLPLAPEGTVVARANPTWEDGEARFPFPLRVRSVLIPDAAEPPEVEVQVGGEWEPVVYPRAVSEPDGLRVLFVPVVAEGIRLGTEAAPRVRVDLGQRQAAPEGFRTERIGPGPDAKLASDSSGMLVVSGPATMGATDDAPFVYSPVADGQAVEATIEAVAGGEVGVVVRSSLDPAASYVGLFVAPDSSLISRMRIGTEIQEDSLGRVTLPVRLQLAVDERGLATTFVEDGAAPQPIQFFPDWPSSGQLGGVLLASDGIAWVSDIRVIGSDVPLPPEIGVELSALVPNPSSGPISFRLLTLESGPYTIEVFDALGRVVTETRMEATQTGYVPVRLDLSGMSAGAYLLRVRHATTGEAAVRPFTITR